MSLVSETVDSIITLVAQPAHKNILGTAPKRLKFNYPVEKCGRADRSIQELRQNRPAADAACIPNSDPGAPETRPKPSTRCRRPARPNRCAASPCLQALHRRRKQQPAADSLPLRPATTSEDPSRPLSIAPPAWRYRLQATAGSPALQTDG